MISRRAISFLVLTTWAVAQAPYPVPVENPPQDTDSIPTFKTSTNLVLIHVNAKTRDGRPFEELTKDDIAVFEDDQPQTVAVFEFQRLSDQVLPASPSLLPAAASPPSNRSQSSAEEQFRDRRLLVLYFDYGSMDLGQQARATDAALRFLQTRMMVSDTIAIYAYTSELHLLQDFTDDRDRLVRAVQQLKTGASDLTYRDQFQNAGDEEFRLFNAERKLNALEDLARNLGRFPETKAIIYFSNGGKGTGIENISLVRATTVAANRANVSFYTVDVRGLDASAPLGDASVASGKGADLFSGQGVGKLRLNALTQQDTMSALAVDTGGKMIFNTNDLSVGAQLAQENMSSYYIVGYYGTNPAADGKFRNIRVQLKIAKAVRLEYRPGYYAPKLFKLMDGREREKQLEEAIQLENPVTDIPIASETNYFRVDYRKYFVSLSTRILRASIPLARDGAIQETQLDFLGTVQDGSGKAIGRISDKIRLKLTSNLAGELSKRDLQYDTGFTLEPGTYVLKFVIRENGEGTMGTFEAPLVIPDLGKTTGLRLSSVVWSGQRERLAAAVGSARESRREELNPLVRGDLKLVPSLTYVYNTRQHLIVYCETYDVGSDPQIRASVGLYKDGKRVYESAAAKFQPYTPPRPETFPVEIDFPLSALSPGEYTAQLNVIDESGRRVAFVRKPIVIVATEPQATQ